MKNKNKNNFFIRTLNSPLSIEKNISEHTTTPYFDSPAMYKNLE